MTRPPPEREHGHAGDRADRTARAFKSMWDAVLDIGRPDTAQEMLIKAEAAFKKADDIWNLRKDDYFG